MQDEPAPAEAAPPAEPATHDAVPADPPPEPIVADFHTTLAFRSDDPPQRGNDRIRFKSPKR